MELGLFDEVADALLGVVPVELGPCRRRARPYGIKVWFGPVRPPREHYEAQVIGPEDVDDATVLAVEVGFHAEHPRLLDNERLIDHLLRAERSWRTELGDEAVAGPFLGRREDWRRVSETWPDPDLSDQDLGVAIALRLVDYVTALEPLRRQRSA